MYEERVRALVTMVKAETEFVLGLEDNERMEYAREIADALIGSDDTAIIRGIGPVGEALVEQLSDMLTTLLVAQLTKAA
jgi:hypothetical protein